MTPRCSQRWRRPSPAGYTLIEMLVVVAILASALTATGVALQTMFQADRQVRDELAQTAVLPKLSLQLRADTHRCQAAELADADTSSLVLTSPDTNVTYRFDKQRLIREVVRGGESIQREAYHLPAGAHVAWETIDAPPQRIRLIISHRRGKIPDAADAVAVRQIDATIGLHKNE